jgi:putative transposase
LRCRAYQPWLKGKIERLNRTIEQTLLCGLPRWAHGPRRPNGQLADPREALTLERFVGIFDAWVRSYNTERPHDGLDGQTPLQRWSQDARPVPTIAAEDVPWIAAA